jgi:hypothetical protein
MTHAEISTASPKALDAREATLLATMGEPSTEIELDAAWAEIDMIREERGKREWALEDPSAGAAFGHFPT